MGNVTINLAIIDDVIVEGDEQFRVTLTNPGSSTGAHVTASGDVLTTIADTDNGGPGVDSADWSISGDGTVNEGDTASFTINLSGILPADAVASVQLALTDISTNPDDYASFNAAVLEAIAAYTGAGSFNWTNGVLTFTSDGNAMGSLVINLATINDELVEGSEQFSVNLSNPAGSQLGGATAATVTLIDSGITPPELDTANWSLAGSADVNEGGTASYTLSLAGTLQAGETASVQLNIINLNASSEDYASFDAAVLAAVDAYNSTGNGSLRWINGVLTFTSAGQPMGNVTINLAIIDDVIVEGDEQFRVTLTNPGSSTGAHVTASGDVLTTIADTDNGGPGLDTAQWSLNGSTQINEGDTATYTINLSGTLQNGENASINLSFADVTTDDQDHEAFNDAIVSAVAAYNVTGPGTLSWANGILTFTSAGLPMAPFTINIITYDDSLVEGPEQFTVVLTNPGSTSGATVTGGGSVSTTIIDFNPDSPNLDTANWILNGDNSINEGDPATYTIRLDGQMQSGERATITLTFADLTTNAQDYGSFSNAVAQAVVNYSCYARFILSSHIFKLPPCKLICSKDQSVLNGKMI